MAGSRFRQSHRSQSSDPFTELSSQQRRPPPILTKSISSSKHSRMATPTKSSIRDTPTDNSTTTSDTLAGTGGSLRSRNIPSQPAPSPSSSGPQQTRRSHSQDGTTNRENSKIPFKSRFKKGSQHADVIDRLDFTSVGPMLHHDGPFDACAPSRNQQRNKAPMFAWSSRADDASGRGNVAQLSTLETDYPDKSRKKNHAMAEAWGMHEPEPYEEFFAGGGTGRTPGDTPTSSIYNGRESNSKTANRLKDSHRESHVDSPLSDSRQTRGRRALAPPPQPVFPTNALDLSDAPSSPKRSRSLMHRIRKMRDSPKSPGSPDLSPTPQAENSYSSGRPTHRPQNSLLGRLGGSRSNNSQLPSDKSEPFVYIDTNNKQLPATPQSRDSAENVEPESSTSPGLARKASLIRKMGRVVGRSRH